MTLRPACQGVRGLVRTLPFGYKDPLNQTKKNFRLSTYIISSRIAGPGKLFSSDFQACSQSPRWATRCSLGSVSCSSDAAPTAIRMRALPVPSSLLSEQRRTWSIVAEQIEIFQVKAWLATFKARNANVKLLDDDVKKTKKKQKKKKTTPSTRGGRSRPPPSIDRRSSQPQSLQIFFQICRVWCL